MAAVTAVTGKQFALLRAGVWECWPFTKVARTVAPGEKDCTRHGRACNIRNMFDGRAKLEPLDNDRYPSIRWTTARDVLSAHQVS